MTGIRMSVTTAGLERLHLRMNNRINFLTTGGMRQVLQDAAQDLAQVLKQRVLDSELPLAPLSEGYRRQKVREVGFAEPILVKTGQLINSMQARVFQGHDGWAIRIRFVGMHRSGVSNERLAQAHILGEGVPARDFTQLPDGWEDEWLAKVSRALRDI